MAYLIAVIILMIAIFYQSHCIICKKIFGFCKKYVKIQSLLMIKWIITLWIKIDKNIMLKIYKS